MADDERSRWREDRRTTTKIRVDRDTVAEIRALAGARGCSIARVVREAVRALQAGTALAEVRRLASEMSGDVGTQGPHEKI